MNKSIPTHFLDDVVLCYKGGNSETDHEQYTIYRGHEELLALYQHGVVILRLWCINVSTIMIKLGLFYNCHKQMGNSLYQYLSCLFCFDCWSYTFKNASYAYSMYPIFILFSVLGHMLWLRFC